MPFGVLGTADLAETGCGELGAAALAEVESAATDAAGFGGLLVEGCSLVCETVGETPLGEVEPDAAEAAAACCAGADD